MRIVQILPPRASEYEKKAQRIDLQLLRLEHEVVVGRRVSADVTLIYGRPPVSELPEAVEEFFFGGGQSIVSVRAVPTDGIRTEKVVSPPFSIGSFRRRSIVPIVEQTMHRLHRTREDIEWLLLDAAPSPGDFAQFDAWIDPAIDETDLDGFVAEAQVAEKIVVASRTPINLKRLEKGRTGLLVPPGDPNELSHAILAALFKTEVAQQKIEAAKQTISKFHPRQRLRALAPLLAR